MSTGSEIVLAASALSVEQVVAQRELIKSAMKSVMEEKVHYGTVPGCGPKPCLFQPGAQILGHLFKLRPEYEVIEKDFDGDHREYRITCRLYHQPTGTEVGQGVGICSTRESKYRFRNQTNIQAKDVVWLDDPIPPIYWTLWNKAKENPQGKEDVARWIRTAFADHEDASRIKTKKDDMGQWRFVVVPQGEEGKVENPNISDVFNTVLKISAKRAFVAAIITATASNDFFTQDLEDIRGNLESVIEVQATPVAGNEPAKEPEKAATPPKTEEKAAPAKPAQKADIQDWKSVRVHFGTVGGKIRDKELGTLTVETHDWLEAKVRERRNPTKQDNILLAALAMAKGERGSKSGACLEMLKAKCEAVKISWAEIVLYNKHLGSKAETFEEIKEDEAKYILDDWKAAMAFIEEQKDEVPM